MSDTPQPSGAPSDPQDGTPSDMRSGDRIAKLLARAGIASRREVERMIEEGRVKIGEQVITTPNTVLENLNGVTVDDNPVKAAEAARLFAFHKPSGLLTAERDPAGRPTIYTALRNALPPGTPRVMPIGRLDLNTEGLLLLTNDGELKRAMELPSSGIARTYRARTFGDITQTQLEDLIEGVEIDGMRYGKINANMERRTGRNQWIELTITEGKNREVRRVLEYLGLQVSRLMRISYGPFQLLDLPRGAAVEIRPVDVERFIRGLKGAPMPLRIAHSAPRPAARPSKPRSEPEARPDRREPRPAAGRPASGHAADARHDQARPTSARPSPARPTPARPVATRPASPRPSSTRPDKGGTEGWRPDTAPIEAPRAVPVRKRRDATTDALHHSSRDARSAADRSRPARAAPGRSERPHSARPYADRASPEKPRTERPMAEDRPRVGKPYADRPSPEKPRSDRPRDDRPRSDRPRDDRPRDDRPRSGKPGPIGKGAPRPGSGPRKGPPRKGPRT